LRRAIELQTSLQVWQERLGQDATLIEVARIQNHRQWTAIARGLSPVIGDWLTAENTTSRCEILLGLEARLTALKKALRHTQDSLAFFGAVSGDGPFVVLSTWGRPGEVEEHCRAFSANIPLLPHYAALLREEGSAKKLGLSNLIKHGKNARISTDMLIQTFRGAVAHQQAKAIWEADDELRYFQSNEHERLRQKFQTDDEKQLNSNRRFIRTRVANGDLTEGSRGRTAGEHTENALLVHEMGKQRRHLPIRKLVNRAGRAMQDLCPCWMMTPLAVAQFLAPGALNFDLVIMDEASQINPEDAWGAIARGNQLVIVGDQKQMPPSDFFMSAMEEDESPEEDEKIDGGKSESILDASVSSLLSSSLLWHYRSRQETLIAPANSFSYDNRLILFPHSHRNHPELGIRYTHIANATTTTGKVTNALEAEAVANRVCELVLREYAIRFSQPLSEGFRAMKTEHHPRPWLGIAFIAEKCFNAGGFVKKRQRPGQPSGQKIGQAGGVATRLFGHGGKLGALALGLNHPNWFAVYEQQVITGSRLEWHLAHGNTAPNREVDGLVILNDPPRRDEHRINPSSGRSLWCNNPHLQTR